VVDCANGSPCGGSVVGVWNVASSCLEMSGEMDTSGVSLGCLTVPVTGSLQTMGKFTANADGTYLDETSTIGSISFPLDVTCLSVSNVTVGCDKIGNAFDAMGWDTVTCTDATGTCLCTGTTVQEGGFGAIRTYTEETGTYTVDGSTLTAANATYSFCTSGDTLTVTPQGSALTGTVTFQREGTGGTGGAAGAGGMSGAGAGGMSGAGAGGMSGAGAGGMGGAAAGAGGKGGMAGSAGSMAGSGGSAGGGTTGPCDIYAAASTPCVAAHSTVRALFGSFNGPLYQVKKSDGTTRDIPTLGPGGFADSAQQESFCSGATCTIWRVYDQSGNGNFLEAETPDSTVGGRQGQTAANASAESLYVGGHKVYSLFTRPSQAYWRDGSNSGMPLGAEPQGVYMVTSGEHYNSGCCYDYGNSQLSRNYEGGNSMDTVYFGNCSIWSTGAGNGPWIMADMENGMIGGGNGIANYPNLDSMPYPYVTAMEKNNGRTQFALKGSDATALPLKTFYEGPGKGTMAKQGAIVLGSGGDCCYSNNNASEGTFYEGAIVAGYPSDETDNAIHANIVEAGYGEQ
jgi:hypothetical protein